MVLLKQSDLRREPSRVRQSIRVIKRQRCALCGRPVPSNAAFCHPCCKAIAAH